jgi:hypothetical protein
MGRNDYGVIVMFLLSGVCVYSLVKMFKTPTSRIPFEAFDGATKIVITFEWHGNSD